MGAMKCELVEPNKEGGKTAGASTEIKVKSEGAQWTIDIPENRVNYREDRKDKNKQY